MQEVTNGAFWKLMHRYGGADVYWTEYFRVHSASRPEKWIVKSIENNATDRPIVAQMIGNDIPALVRTAQDLQEHPVAAVDLNLGCPALTWAASTFEGRHKVTIDPAMCIGCSLCAQVCTVDCIKVPETTLQ